MSTNLAVRQIPGSSPAQLRWLFKGELDEVLTSPDNRLSVNAGLMLEAGNELSAEHAGCVPLARVADVCTPYLGTVLGVVGRKSLEPARRLAAALRATADDICAGSLDDVTVDEAAFALRLPRQLADRYVGRQGFQVDEPVGNQTLRRVLEPGVVDLRRRYLPSIVDGIDVLAGTLDPRSGLVVPQGPCDR